MRNDGLPMMSPLKLALMGLAGASIEWYDFFLYATAAALVFPTVFFAAKLPPMVALIASFSTFAVGFMARPIGALLFGHLGDRMGRKAALVGALVLMGTATTLIGLLPPYRVAGALSPLALVVLRFLQGLAVGGQWGGAMLLATESAPKASRGLYGSIAQAGVPLGVILANLAFLAANAAMPADTFLSYGWRIPFLFSIVLVGLGIFLHFRVAEPAPFRRVENTAKRTSPIVDALRLHPRLILLAAGAYVSTNLSFYILITYIVSYGTGAGGLHLPRSTMLLAVLIANAAGTPLLFLAGALSDRFGRRRVFMSGVALAALWAFALFPLVDTRKLIWITAALFVGGGLNSLTYGPMAAMFTELFSSRVRYSAVSLAYQIGAILGGGLAPIVATGLYAQYHSNFGVSLYIAGSCALSLVCANRLETAHDLELGESPTRATAQVSPT